MIIKDIVNYVNTEFTNFATVRVDIVSTEEKAIAFRPETSDPRVTRYMDNTVIGQFNIRVMCASDDINECLTQLEYYTEKFNIEEIIQLTDKVMISADILTVPVFNGIDDDGRYHYSMSISIEYKENGGV